MTGSDINEAQRGNEYLYLIRHHCINMHLRAGIISRVSMLRKVPRHCNYPTHRPGHGTGSPLCIIPTKLHLLVYLFIYLFIFISVQPVIHVTSDTSSITSSNIQCSVIKNIYTAHCHSKRSCTTDAI